MRQIIAGVLLIVLMLSLAGCYDDSDYEEETKTVKSKVTEQTRQYEVTSTESGDTTATQTTSTEKKTASTSSEAVTVSPEVKTTTVTSSASAPMKLIFLHHSTGENWLADGYGNLGKTLDKNRYFVSDTNYGWGPNDIGDTTDIPDWLKWFSSSKTSKIMSAAYAEDEQNSDYTRTLSDPGGENEIIMFKSCFPNSELEGNPNDPASSSDEEFSVGHSKYVYNEILKYFDTQPDKLFVVITAPPVSDNEYAANARAFNDWLVDDWLKENGYTKKNVAVFDFYNVLTGPNNHHRYKDGKVEWVTSTAGDTLHYPSDDDHPSEAGSQKATKEFVAMLDYFVRCWKGTASC